MYTNTIELVEFIKTIPELKQTDKVQFENTDDCPWGVVSLIKCDDHGCFSFDKKKHVAQVNLIELLFSDTEESLSHYLEIGTRIAKKLDWKISDDHNDEI
ncbi:hypothetical protein [Aquimarina sediminis]|uniref:hypothetical protein n=1 Tax=Aquimarina sediminis TaxID=2070536 RepID=UPI000CA08F1C|nr:hypothetical protein [Aquimarina sediminis]